MQIGQPALTTLSIRPSDRATNASFNMTDTPEYTPPQVWLWEKDDSPEWRYGHINRPVAGAPHEKELPVGRHPLQLYSLGTPNGVKVTIMLEELLARGHKGAEYDAWLIRIFETGAILMHLAEKFGKFLPTEPGERAECLSWLFWQMGSTPYVGGGFGPFYAVDPVKIKSACYRLQM